MHAFNNYRCCDNEYVFLFQAIKVVSCVWKTNLPWLEFYQIYYIVRLDFSKIINYIYTEFLDYCH